MDFTQKNGVISNYVLFDLRRIPEISFRRAGRRMKKTTQEWAVYGSVYRNAFPLLPRSP
jgi:hypothetical protein